MVGTVIVAFRIVAAAFIALGLVWILQGINVLPGSVMTGQIQWAWRGGALAAIGLCLLVYLLRRRRG